MKKFEYFVIPTHIYSQTTETLENYLNELGDKGYELVAIDYASFIFKKELDTIQ